MDDYEVVAEELSKLAEKWHELEERLTEVERVNARLEEAALTTARGLGEVSRHWDAVYDAMRRADRIDRQISSERDHDALSRVAASHRTRVAAPELPAQRWEFVGCSRWDPRGDREPGTLARTSLPPSAAALIPSSARSEPYRERRA